MNGCVENGTQRDVKFVKASKEDVTKVSDMCRDVALGMMNRNVEQWELIFPDKDIIKADISLEHMFMAQEEMGDDVVGCAVLDEQQQAPEFKKIGWKYNNGKTVVLRRLMISPKYEGVGVGTKLLDYLEKNAAENKFEAIRIELSASNKNALTFYKNRGYNIAGTITLKKGKYYGCEKKLK